MPDESMAELVTQHLKGALPDDIWKEVVQGFCRTKVGQMPNQRRHVLKRGGWGGEGRQAGSWKEVVQEIKVGHLLI